MEKDTLASIFYGFTVGGIGLFLYWRNVLRTQKTENDFYALKSRVQAQGMRIVSLEGRLAAFREEHQLSLAAITETVRKSVISQQDDARIAESTNIDSDSVMPDSSPKTPSGRYATRRYILSPSNGSPSFTTRDNGSIRSHTPAAPSRGHVLLQTSVDIAPNNILRWDIVLHIDSRWFRQSDRCECVTVVEEGLYLAAVRCIYSNNSDLPRILALLINGVVCVQYGAPKHGCFGPTEILHLTAGSALSVEYYDGGIQDNVNRNDKRTLEGSGLSFSVVRL